ncbi:hypothetical protein MNBD_ALPHA05-544, partial [hydrothermal vent metagenome]
MKPGAKSAKKKQQASAPTRQTILDLLKRRGEQSASALGKALGVTPMAA